MLEVIGAFSFYKGHISTLCIFATFYKDTRGKIIKFMFVHLPLFACKVIFHKKYEITSDCIRVTSFSFIFFSVTKE